MACIPAYAAINQYPIKNQYLQGYGPVQWLTMPARTLVFNGIAIQILGSDKHSLSIIKMEFS